MYQASALCFSAITMAVTKTAVKPTITIILNMLTSDVAHYYCNYNKLLKKFQTKKITQKRKSNKKRKIKLVFFAFLLILRLRGCKL